MFLNLTNFLYIDYYNGPLEVSQPHQQTWMKHHKAGARRARGEPNTLRHRSRVTRAGVTGRCQGGRSQSSANQAGDGEGQTLATVLNRRTILKQEGVIVSARYCIRRFMFNNMMVWTVDIPCIPPKQTFNFICRFLLLALGAFL